MFKYLFRWQKGRQLSGYDKMLLAALMCPFKLDMYLLRFPTGSEIASHTDKVLSGRHFRLNIVIKEAKKGGHFYCDTPLFETKRIKLFRPDVNEHAVTRIDSGCRYVFSIGWLRSEHKDSND